MQFLFDTDIATKYGVNEAIFLNNIAFWTKTNYSNGINSYDGRTWTYNSINAFCLIFPFWSVEQIRTIIRSCMKHQLIHSGNYNTAKYDRTKWYSLSDIGLQLFPSLICGISQMHLGSLTNPFVEKPKPIPDSKPDSKPDITHTDLSSMFFKQKDQSCITPAPEDMGVQVLITPAPHAVPPAPKDIPIDHNLSIIFSKKDLTNTVLSSKRTVDGFNNFWEMYPKKAAKKKCIEIWKRRKLESIADEINEKLELQVTTDDQWIRGFIPNPSTYLNGDRWNDDINISKASVLEKEREAKKIDDDKRIAEQHKRSQQRAEQVASKYTQLIKDGEGNTSALKKVYKSTPLGFKDLKDSLGIKT